MQAKSNLKEHADRGKNDGDKNTNDIHDNTLSF